MNNTLSGLNNKNIPMIKNNTKALYQSLNQKSKGHLDILRRTFVTYAKTRAPQSAAALAYYAIFSLFPILLITVAGASYFLDSPILYQELMQIIQITIPVPSQLISENLNHLIEARGTVGLMGGLTLLWSASGLFSNLAKSICIAWPKDSQRNFLQIRLIGIGMVIGFSALLILSLVLTGFKGLFPFFDGQTSFLNRSIWRSLTSFGSWLVKFFLFLILYRWVPTKDVRSKATFWGALTASIAWEIAIWGFSVYLKSGLKQYQLIYGSLGAVVALLFLVYILSCIVLFGAHLSAAIDHWEKQRQQEAQKIPITTE